MKKEEVSVEVNDGRLTLRTERHEREERKDRDYLVRESTSMFSRTVRLPDGADISAITAELNDGVLTITVPTPQAVEKKRTIEVTGGGEATDAEAIEG